MRDRPQILADQGKLLTPGEVAELFAVDPKTVNRWATENRLDYVRTLGGHRRYREDHVRALLEQGTPPARG